MQSGEDWRGDDYLSQYVEQVAVAARPSSAPRARAFTRANIRSPAPPEPKTDQKREQWRAPSDRPAHRLEVERIEQLRSWAEQKRVQVASFGNYMAGSFDSGTRA
jgi:hypothetical protein